MKYFNLETKSCDFNKEFPNPWSRDVLCAGAQSETSVHVRALIYPRACLHMSQLIRVFSCARHCLWCFIYVTLSCHHNDSWRIRITGVIMIWQVRKVRFRDTEASFPEGRSNNVWHQDSHQSLRAQIKCAFQETGQPKGVDIEAPLEWGCGCSFLLPTKYVHTLQTHSSPTKRLPSSPMYLWLPAWNLLLRCFNALCSKCNYKWMDLTRCIGKQS